MAAFPPRLTATAVVLMMLAAACSAAPARAAAAGPDEGAYRVHLKSNGDATSWRGGQTVAFTNQDDQPLARVWLRLWANGADGCGPRAVRVTGVDGGTKASFAGAARRSRSISTSRSPRASARASASTCGSRSPSATTGSARTGA